MRSITARPLTLEAYAPYGDVLMAAVWFGVALRTGRASAESVLEAIHDRHDAAIELVRGDAQRLLGREEEAVRAYESAAAALAEIREAGGR